MNAPSGLPSDARAESEANELDGVQVLGTCWLDCDTDPPRLQLRLSNGGYVQVSWDFTYSHRLLYFAPDVHAEFVSATAEQTGLSEDVLGPIEDQVFRAYAAHESQWRSEYESDAFNHSDGRDF